MLPAATKAAVMNRVTMRHAVDHDVVDGADVVAAAVVTRAMQVMIPRASRAVIPPATPIHETSHSIASRHSTMITRMIWKSK
jgi:hypothetical protein